MIEIIVYCVFCSLGFGWMKNIWGLGVVVIVVVFVMFFEVIVVVFKLIILVVFVVEFWISIVVVLVEIAVDVVVVDGGEGYVLLIGFCLIVIIFFI